MKFLKSFFKYPWLIIVLCLAVTGACGFFIARLTMDNSARQFFPQKDESYDRLTKTEEVFGSMISIGISLEAKTGTILTPEYIDVVKRISERVEELSNIEDVDSITSIDFVCDHDGTISATPIIPDEDFETPDGLLSAESIAALEGRLAEWEDMYNRVIVNDDLTATQMALALRPKGDTKVAFDNAKTAYEKAVERNRKGEATKEDVRAAKKELADIKAENKKICAETLAAYKAAKLTNDKEKILAAQEEYINANSWINDSARQQFVLKQVTKIAEEEVAGHNVILKIVGQPVQSKNSKDFMLADLTGLIPLVIIVVLVSLYMSFHTIEGTLLPLVTVLMSTVISVGLMGFFGYTFTLVSSVIPVALIAVGSAYGIHVLTHYYVELKSMGAKVSREMHEEALFKGIKEVSVSVLLAGITTIMGFISLITSPLVPLHSFSIFTAVGVTVSLLLSVTFIPAIILLKDPEKMLERKYKRLEKVSDVAIEKIRRIRNIRGGKNENEASGNTLYGIFKFFCGTGVRLVITSIAIIVLSVTGIRLLKVDTALINYFPKNSKFRQEIDYVDSHFAGTNSIYFLVSGQEKGDITNVEILKAVDDMQKYLESTYDDIGKMVSLTSFIKRINQVWHVPGARPAETASADSGSSSSDASFGDGFGDDWGDFGNDGFGDDFGSDWGDFGSETETAAADEIPEGWEDPNIIYSQRLGNQMTAFQFLDTLNQAYIAAGGKHASVEDIVAYIMRNINYNGMAYYEIPYNIKKYPVVSREALKKVVDGYLILLSGSLDRFIDDPLNPKTMRITCQLRAHNTEVSGKIIREAQKYAKDHFPEGYVLEATGSGEMEYTMTDMIISSQLASLCVSLFSVFLIIMISFRSVWAGLLGVIPLAFTIILNYMIMGFFHINLDFLTSIIASVAVGVGIDYTIHFLTTYREERSKTDDVVVVAKNTFKKSGRGIVTNAMAVGLGFLVLCLSKFIVLRYIGILVAIVMFASSFLAMTIIPGILTLFDPKFIRPRNK